MNKFLIDTGKLFLATLLLSFTLLSCTEKTIVEENDTGLSSVASCEGCHTNYEHLKLVYSEDTEAPAGGCGGDAPHYEPYDRVYMGGDGFEAFKNSAHYGVGCVACHNGVDGTDIKDDAHSGDFIKHPSGAAEEKCATCHAQIVENFAKSLHNGTGQKRKVTMRNGLDGFADFDKLPQHQIDGYNANCATCHGTCGNCHIVRPPIGGGGLADGHNFAKTPDMLNVCVTCHTSRGGHAYLGAATGTKPDVHLTKNGYTCLNCHDAGEMHGEGTMVDQRYAYEELPTCQDCHSETDLLADDENRYHKLHLNDFDCYVCHSQDYNNCASCHIHGEGARIPSYMDYKIALNPIPDIKQDYKLSLVRRTLAAPDSWQEYGVEESETFDVLPTYNYTTPHNILRWTSRTDGESCYENCHIKGGTVNKELYLFESDLLDWEKSANQGIVVDGKLPEHWF